MNENKIITNENSEEVSYLELASRVGDCVMFNNAFQVLEDLECENGEEYHLNDEGEIDENSDPLEIYQTYCITSSGADYLKRKTNELVYYSEKANMYFWCITHFGTSWSIVFTNILK